MLSTSKLVIAPDWQPALHAGKLDHFDALWNLDGEIAKRGNSTEVIRGALDSHTVFVKKYRVRNLNQLLSAITRGALFGTSKVRREYENMQQLRAWGLDAPAPVAYGEVRCAGWLVRSLLASEAVPNPMPLDAFIRHLWERPSGRDRVPSRTETRLHNASVRTQLIDHLAEYVRRLHEHRFVHYDLYWRNIILGGGATDRFYLLDAHKGRIWEPAHEQEARAQDLATLDAPAPAFFRRTERLRFLLRYLNKQRLDEDGKVLARLVLARAEPMRERQLARIREARR